MSVPLPVRSGIVWDQGSAPAARQGRTGARDLPPRACRTASDDVALRSAEPEWKAGYRHRLGNARQRPGSRRAKPVSSGPRARRRARWDRARPHHLEVPVNSVDGWGDRRLPARRIRGPGRRGAARLRGPGRRCRCYLLDRGWSRRSGRGRWSTPGDRRGAPRGRSRTSASRRRCPTSPSRTDGIGDCQGTDGEAWDNEAGASRSGRLVAPNEGAHEDDESGLIATDVGIDGAAASARRPHAHRRRGHHVRLTRPSPPRSTHAAGQAPRLPLRRLPRPRRRVRVPHPVHRDERPDHRAGRR